MCDYCEKNKQLPTTGPEVYVEYNENNYFLLITIGSEPEILILYCPMCGRKLGE